MWSQRSHAWLTWWHTHRYSWSASLSAVHQFCVAQEWDIHETRIRCVENCSILAPTSTAIRENNKKAEKKCLVIKICVCVCFCILYLVFFSFHQQFHHFSPLHTFCCLITNYGEIRNGIYRSNCACTWHIRSDCAMCVCKYLPKQKNLLSMCVLCELYMCEQCYGIWHNMISACALTHVPMPMCVRTSYVCKAFLRSHTLMWFSPASSSQSHV